LEITSEDVAQFGASQQQCVSHGDKVAHATDTDRIVAQRRAPTLWSVWTPALRPRALIKANGRGGSDIQALRSTGHRDRHPMVG
jgi:hypothetical protein